MLVCYGTGDHPDYRLHPRRRTDKSGQEYRLFVSRRDGGGRYIPTDRVPDPPEKRPDCSDLATRCEDAITADLAGRLLADLRLPAWASRLLDRVGTGFIPAWRKKRAAWTARERDGDGRTVGLSCRHSGGDKSFVRGTHRGLTYDPDWRAAAEAHGVVFVVEGFSDVVAMLAAGLPVIGRPSNVGGAADLAVLLAGLPAGVRIVIVGENDLKNDGRWPGRAGAYIVAAQLRAALDRPVWVSMMPAESTAARKKHVHYKDARDYLTHRAGESAGPGRWATVGGELAAALTGAARPSQDPDITDLAEELAEQFRAASCPAPCHLQTQYKPESPRAGQRCVFTARCGKWQCAACGPWKARNLFAETTAAILPYISPDEEVDSVESDGVAGPWPGDPGHLRETGPWDCYAWYIPHSRRERLSRAIFNPDANGVGGGERIVIRTLATVDDLHDAAGRNVGLKPVEDPIPSSSGSAKSDVSAHLRAYLVLAVLPPGKKPPRDGHPVGPRELVHLEAEALRHVPKFPDDPNGRLRPVEVSSGLRIPDDEHVGQSELVGTSAYAPAVVKEKVTDPLGVSLPASVTGRNVQGKATGWRAPTPLLSWLLSEFFQQPKGDAPVRPVEMIVPVYRRWEQVLNETLSPADDGPEVKRLVTLYLWDGPPSILTEDLAAAAESDRLDSERRERMRAASQEAREIGDSLREQWKADPNSVPRLIRETLEITEPKVMSPAECRRRLKRLRRASAPRWRAGDQTKSKMWANYRKTAGR